MFGRKKKEETQAVQFNPLQDNDSEFPMPTLPSQEQEQQPQSFNQQPQSFSQQPTQSFAQERPRFPQQQPQQQPKKIPRGHFKIIGGEIVENGFRYIVLSDMSMKMGDEIEWFE